MIKIAILSLRSMSKCTLLGSLKKSADSINKEADISVVNLDDVVVEHNADNLDFFYENTNLIDFDAFLIRVNSSVNKDLLFLIASTLRRRGKLVINESYCGVGSLSDKLSFLGVAQELGISHPKTFFIQNQHDLKRVLDKLEFPFIIKDYQGWQGSSVEKMESIDELKKIENNFPENGLLVQEYIPMKSDIRVLVVGYEAIGAMERFSSSDDFRTNISLGGHGEKFELTQEMKDLAERIARETKNDILGVDFIFKEGRIMVLEIEECPGVKGFRMATRINVSDRIIKYIFEKLQK